MLERHHQISNGKRSASKISGLVEVLRTYEAIKITMAHFIQRWSGWVGLLLKRLTWAPASTRVSTDTTQPSQQSIICVGIFSTVHRLGDVVRKVPSPSDTGDFPSNCKAIRNEAQIYSLLGSHTRIAECLSANPTDNHIDLHYYPNGTLLDYIKTQGDNISGRRRWRWGQQIIEAVVLLHSHGIIHSDLALRQYLVDDRLDARLSDFGASAFPGHDALGLENASHCLPRDFDQPNTVESDLFALGSTLYELGTGVAPYCDLNDNEIACQYAREVFPDVSGTFCGEIILQCWKRNFISAEHVLSSYNTLLKPDFKDTPFLLCRIIANGS
jgi:serine/threonine protein kinase